MVKHKKKKKRKRKWIQRAHPKKGALHRQLGIAVGETIPYRTLIRHRHASGLLGRRVRFALNVRKHKRNRRG